MNNKLLEKALLIATKAHNGKLTNPVHSLYFSSNTCVKQMQYRKGTYYGFAS